MRSKEKLDQQLLHREEEEEEQEEQQEEEQPEEPDPAGKQFQVVREGGEPPPAEPTAEHPN